MAAPPTPSVPERLLTVDELAAAARTTTRHVRSLQTLGLLPRPELRGRTGLYGAAHHERLVAVLALQEQGFSLESLRILFDAHAAGRSLASVLGLPEDRAAGTPDEGAPGAPGAAPGAAGGGDGVEDAAALYGFFELQPTGGPRRLGAARPVLSVVPTTVWDENRAS